MGAIVPTLAQSISYASGVAGVADQVLGIGGASSSHKNLQREQDLALRQLQAKQNLQAQQLAAETALERESIALNAEQDEQNRLSTLKRAVARQRANAGASGISSGDGSAQAVLLGLFEETEGELNNRERLDNLRNSALDLDVANQSSINVLQRTQLRQKQDFERELLDHNFLF